MPVLKWAPFEPSSWNPLGDIAFETVARWTNRTKLWEIWRSTKNLKILVSLLCYLVWNRHKYTGSQTRQHALPLGQRNLNKNTTRHNTTQHNTTRGRAHTVTYWYSYTKTKTLARTYVHTHRHTRNFRSCESPIVKGCLVPFSQNQW